MEANSAHRKFPRWLIIILGIVSVLILAFIALVIIHPTLPSTQSNPPQQQANEDNRYQTLIGTWTTNKDASYSPLVTFMFEPGQKGIKYELINNSFMASDFTYKFNGDTIELAATGEKPRDFQFQMIDGNTMILIENGKSVTYIRPGIATGISNKY